MAKEIDDNTLDNAGEVGRDLADALTAKVIEMIEGFPCREPKKQQVAIARIIANNLYDWAGEMEG